MATITRYALTALRTTAIAGILGAIACSSGGDEAPGTGQPAPVLDGENDSFGIGKADDPAGGYSSCQLREVLRVINECSTDSDRLRTEVRLHKNAAENIYAHRIGPDAAAGTADDDLFDDLKELDDVPFVGPAALETLAGYINWRCRIDAEGRPLIHSETFAGTTGGGWTRDAIEMEATFKVSGITGPQLRDVISGVDDRGRPVFNRVRRSKVMEAFTMSYDLDEIPWDSDAHAVREMMPYMAYTIESGRFEPDEDEPEEREISLGTDKMDDTYYDTHDFLLTDNAMSVRGRIRWDTDTAIRRLLIAAKFGSGVDDEGIKRAGKVDVRTEGGTHAATIDEDVRSGTVPWSGSNRTPIEPIKVVYDKLVELDKLPDVETYKQVLVLDPKAHLRSIRARFHLNFMRNDAMKKVYDNGRSRVQFVVDYAKAQVAAGSIDSGDLTDVNALITAGEAILDHSAIDAEADAGLKELDAMHADTVFVDAYLDSGNAPADVINTEKRRVVSEATDRVMHSFAESVDDLDRTLSRTRNLPDDEFVDMFIAWQKSMNSSLMIKTTVAPFMPAYEALAAMDPADRATEFEKFNTYGAAQLADGNNDFDDFRNMDEEVFERLGRHLDFEMLKLSDRQIEAAGTIANAIYFEVAREFYIPGSNRPYSNFIIDTTDYTEMMSHDAWISIPEDQRTPASEIPACKVFHSTLVNEVQIELTEIKPFVERVDELKAELEAAGGSDPQIEAMLAGSRFILDRFTGALGTIGELKKDGILDELEDNGAPDTVEWVPAEHSKGDTALLILTDKI